MTQLTYLFISSLIFLSCNSSSKKDIVSIHTGERKPKVDGGEIWYKVSGLGTQTPIVLLHGGPGYSSFYLKPLEEIGDDRQVVRYDQLGSGKSDFVQDSSLFTIDHFVENLDSLRRSLNIESWNVLGHSWGTILAYEYYLKYPASVKALIFGSPCLNLVAWEKSTNQLLKTLPDSLRQAVVVADPLGKYDDPLYEKAINMFYDKYLWGSNYIEEEVDSIIVLPKV